VAGSGNGRNGYAVQQDTDNATSGAAKASRRRSILKPIMQKKSRPKAAIRFQRAVFQAALSAILFLRR
jgi:hypothetical protein